MRALLCATLLLAVSGQVQAFHLQVRSDSPLVDEEGLRSRVNTAAAAVRHNIPDSEEVYVYASTRAKPRTNDAGKYLYFHRIELRRHFSSREPYPYNGWLPIKSEEYYGVDDVQGVQQQLDNALRRFFGEVKALSPKAYIK